MIYHKSILDLFLAVVQATTTKYAIPTKSYFDFLGDAAYHDIYTYLGMPTNIASGFAHSILHGGVQTDWIDPKIHN